ncbi:MAG: S24 family peptidase [Bryobacteraceae bacterium]
MSDKTGTMPTAEYVLLQLELPARSKSTVGVLMVDPAADRIYFKLREDWDAIAEEEDVEVLCQLQRDFETKGLELGAEAFLRSLEDSLSNTLLVTKRESIPAAKNYSRVLERLFDQHVKKSKVIPFVTHLPLYSLRAAATKFGTDMEVSTELEPEDWLRAPERLRLTPKMFIARVVGRSMEPLIPDGSLCVFRTGVVGSRQGKRLLIQQLGTSESGGEFTVKRYQSRKVETGEDEWQHSSIRLEPLNPEIEPMEFDPADEHRRFRVIGEFVEVLD